MFRLPAAWSKCGNGRWPRRLRSDGDGAAPAFVYGFLRIITEISVIICVSCCNKGPFQKHLASYLAEIEGWSHASSCQQDEKALARLSVPLWDWETMPPCGLTTSVIEPQRGVEKLRLLRGPLTKIRSSLQGRLRPQGRGLKRVRRYIVALKYSVDEESVPR